MSKKKKTLVALFVLLGVAVLGLAGAVYAKYISSINRVGSLQVAKWAFREKNPENGEITCSITSSVKTGTLVNDKIAPGTEGNCVIELSNSTGEVSVDYTIEVDATNTTTPTNLLVKNHEDTDYSALTNFTIVGAEPIAINGTKTVTIDWKWPYETGTDADDENDTDDGENADDMSIKFIVTGVQSDPRN